MMQEKTKPRLALVVDDQPMMLRLCQAVLMNLGYRVFKAGSKEEALRILEESGTLVTLLITDIVMSSLYEGIELAAQVVEEFPHIRIIYMSGFSQGAALEKILNEKSTLFLQKPFVVTSLEAMVKIAEEPFPPI